MYCRSFMTYLHTCSGYCCAWDEFVRVYWRWGSLAIGIITVGPLGPISALVRVNVAHETEFVRVYWRWGSLAIGIIRHNAPGYSCLTPWSHSSPVSSSSHPLHCKQMYLCHPLHCRKYSSSSLFYTGFPRQILPSAVLYNILLLSFAL